jgi:hypothetical protein
MATRKLSAVKQLAQIVGFDLEKEGSGRFGGTFYESVTRGLCRRWLLFTDGAAARKAAIKQVAEYLRDEPLVFNQKWLKGFVVVPKDIVTQLVGEWDRTEETRAEWRSGLQQYLEYAAEEPILFLEEHELDFTDFIDVKRAAEGAVKQDGVEHFLGTYDGEYIHPTDRRNNTWVAFRTD